MLDSTRLPAAGVAAVVRRVAIGRRIAVGRGVGWAKVVRGTAWAKVVRGAGRAKVIRGVITAPRLSFGGHRQSHEGRSKGNDESHSQHGHSPGTIELDCGCHSSLMDRGLEVRGGKAPSRSCLRYGP